MEFYAICGKYLIDPAIAMENQRVVEAIKRKAKPDEMEKILSEEF